jgi:hypothetical protein
LTRFFYSLFSFFFFSSALHFLSVSFFLAQRGQRCGGSEESRRHGGMDWKSRDHDGAVRIRAEDRWQR